MARTRRDVPWLDKRDHGTYYAFWYSEDTRRTHRKSLGTNDRVEAQRFFAEFLLAGPPRTGGNAGLTVAQVLDDYAREHVATKVVDAGRQMGAIANLKAYFGDDKIADVDITKSRGYAAARRAGAVGGGIKWKPRPGTDSTIRRELTALVAAANHALLWKRLDRKDLPQIELPAENPSEGVKFFTKDQMRTLITGAADDIDLQDFIVLAYYTASRRTAIENLTTFQVSLATSRINLAAAGSRVTKKRKPVVPIYPEIRSIIERRVEGAIYGRLFPPQTDFYYRFGVLTRKLGWDAHPHMLRHSRATHMLMDGDDIYKVARLLGDTVETVDRVYGHAVPEFLETTSNVN